MVESLQYGIIQKIIINGWDKTTLESEDETGCGRKDGLEEGNAEQDNEN